MVGVTKYNMTENYKQKLAQGREYEEFVCKQLKKKMCLSINVFSNKKEQYNIGESKQGFEIKLDNKFQKTKNIYIEISEKSNPNNRSYVDSGIYRDDNSWIVLIGNYEVIYFFGKNDLKLMHESKKYREVQTSTSKGFLIPEKDCEKYKLKKITI